MNKYEAMFILKPDLSEEEKKALFNQLSDTVVKQDGNVLSGALWSDKRKMIFPIRKYQEGLYYLMNFSIPADAVAGIRQAYKMNENILRVLITKA